MATGGGYNDAQYIHRLSNIDTDLVDMLIPIDGYEDVPLVPLEIAVEPLVPLVPHIHIHAYSITERCKNPPADGLTIDESASIMLYSMDWKPLEKSLYIILNAALKSAVKEQLEPWYLYLKLFFTALSRLPSTRHGHIYRGIKSDLSQQYPTGERILWSGFSLCTTSMNVLEEELFVGSTEPRTIFRIKCNFGKDIGNHTYYSSENGIVLLPPTQFKVIDCVNQGNGLHIIELKEIQPCFSHLHPPVFSSISSKLSSKSKINSTINHNKKWKQTGIYITEMYGKGPGLNQVYFPCGVYVDDDQTIYIADSGNHRIMAWKHDADAGEIVAGGNGRGNGMNQLDWPRNMVVDRKRNHVFISDLKNRRVMRWPYRNGTSGEIFIPDICCAGLAMDNDGYLYVSDSAKDEVRRWKNGDTHGTLIAGGNGAGDHLNQLCRPASIVIDDNQSLYILDNGNHRVMKWMKGAKEGTIVAGGCGNGPIELLSSYGLVVDHLDTVYVADRSAHRILRWYKGATQWDIIISNSERRFEGLDFPQDLSMDRHGNFYVVECSYHRLQRFDVDRS